MNNFNYLSFGNVPLIFFSLSDSVSPTTFSKYQAYSYEARSYCRIAIIIHLVPTHSIHTRVMHSSGLCVGKTQRIFACGKHQQTLSKLFNTKSNTLHSGSKLIIQKALQCREIVKTARKQTRPKKKRERDSVCLFVFHQSIRAKEKHV